MTDTGQSHQAIYRGHKNRMAKERLGGEGGTGTQDDKMFSALPALGGECSSTTLSQ